MLWAKLCVCQNAFWDPRTIITAIYAVFYEFFKERHFCCFFIKQHKLEKITVNKFSCSFKFISWIIFIIIVWNVRTMIARVWNNNCCMTLILVLTYRRSWHGIVNCLLKCIKTEIKETKDSQTGSSGFKGGIIRYEPPSAVESFKGAW